MPWDAIPFSEAIRKTTVGRENQIRSSEIQQRGLFPVVDQGQDFIAGYSDADQRVIRDELPVVIFGDHTRCFKYVDFPFILGADGTKVLKPKESLFHAKFFYYALLSLDIPNRGYNRHFTVLKERKIPRPDPPEQMRIAGVLGLVQRAVEQQERLLALVAELKQTLLHHLFTHGFRGESRRQTDIGLLPESWKLVKAEDVCGEITVGIVVRPSSYYVSDGIPALRSQNVRRDRVQEEPMVYISRGAHEGAVAKSCINAGDVLVVRTGANLGMSCVVPKGFDGSNCIDLVIMRPRQDLVDGRYLSRFLNSDAAKRQIHAGKVGLAQQHYNVGTAKRTLIPLPSREHQCEIVSVLEAIDNKHDVHQRKHSALTSLFRTLLHQLMTAQLRVSDLDVESLLPQAVPVKPEACQPLAGG